jgi:hypothetical protein
VGLGALGLINWPYRWGKKQLLKKVPGKTVPGKKFSVEN